MSFENSEKPVWLYEKQQKINIKYFVNLLLCRHTSTSYNNGEHVI